jgi:hypothetical protein
MNVIVRRDDEPGMMMKGNNGAGVAPMAWYSGSRVGKMETRLSGGESAQC